MSTIKSVKTYEKYKKKTVCGRERLTYRKVNSKSKKEYLIHKGKYIQLKKYISLMSAKKKSNRKKVCGFFGMGMLTKLFKRMKARLEDLRLEQL